MNKFIILFDIFSNITFIYNGLYDITCCICILYYPCNKIAHIHSNSFNNTQIDYFTKRILAYWILTYSIPRIIAGFYNYLIIKISCAMTYFIEGTAYYIEYKYYKSTNNKTLFIICTSYILGSISCIQAHTYNIITNLPNKSIYSYENIIIIIINTIIWYLGINLSII